MTYEQWCKTVIDELTAKGFKVGIYAGLPLVKELLNMAQRLTLLKLQLSVDIEKAIYAEGMLITPRKLHEMEL